MDARNQVQAAVQKVLDKIDVLQHGPPEDLAKNVQSYLHQLSEVDRKAPLLGKSAKGARASGAIHGRGPCGHAMRDVMDVMDVMPGWIAADLVLGAKFAERDVLRIHEGGS
ncbi:unnamed protein product [Cladocopium goreaui]|uniref:Uncharacterized protein n=1 Tax=Cladocopium goreaui TaxID=2562237 RepID=A0A9P1CGH5_9DINO|nr:unnamed protein product [Cladocopium goreaui]